MSAATHDEAGGTGWSPELYIGGMRPWPDTVQVVRSRTDEMRRYVPEREECHRLPPDNDSTCVVRHGPTGMQVEFGYWKCSVCGCNCFEGARYCMGCGAKVVSS